MEHASTAVLESSVGHVRLAPRDEGTVELIVCRPAVNKRTVLQEAMLDTQCGLVGDTWSTRESTSTADGAPNPEAQVTLVNARAIAVIAGAANRWALAGDQLYVDFDLSIANLPARTRLRVGSAVVEISAKPHTGCAKYRRRFGVDAVRFVNSATGRELRLRGANARVVESGTVRQGDRVRIVV